MENKDKPTSNGCAIPTRMVTVNDPSEIPNGYGTTPGGTMFSTTPGGTRIIYDRQFLLHCRNSPLAKSPLTELPRIPGLTCEDNSILEETLEEDDEEDKPAADADSPRPEEKENEATDEQFQMDV